MRKLLEISALPVEQFLRDGLQERRYSDSIAIDGLNYNDQHETIL